MSQNYTRNWSVHIEGLGTYTQADGLRVRFNIKHSTVEATGTATIRLTNNLRSAAERFCKDPHIEGKIVGISAGYDGNSGVIFAGHVVRAIYGRENPTDTLTQILCTDGAHAISYATVNKSFPPGSTPKDHYDEALKEMQKYAVKPGFTGQSIDLSQPKYPRSVALFGMARKVLDDIAKLKKANWSVQDGLVDMVTGADAKSGGAYVLNSQTGLIGMPTLTPEGVYVRALINPQLRKNMQVHIDQSLIQGYLPELGPTGQVTPQFQGQGVTVATTAADGIYNIVWIDIEADTRGQPWYQDMLCLVPGQNTPSSIDSGYYSALGQ